jgi:hypothetical protein
MFDAQWLPAADQRNQTCQREYATGRKYDPQAGFPAGHLPRHQVTCGIREGNDQG